MFFPSENPEKPTYLPPLLSTVQPVRGQSLVMARWLAILGQSIAIFVSFYGFGFGFPFIPCLGFIALSGIVNNYAHIKDHHRTMSIRRAFFYLVFDIIQLTGLLFLTGGIDNPFSVLLLAPVLVGASLLTRNYMIYLILTGLTCALIISVFFVPLHWPANYVDSQQIHLVAQSIGLAVALIFSGFFAWQIAEESRAILKASYAAKTALLKQKQLQALGAQAAAAVHELGSPLGTITIVAKELSLELGNSHPQIDDVNLLIDQTKRCQSILKDFGTKLRFDSTYLSTPLPIADVIKTIASEFLKERPEIRLDIQQSEKTEHIKFIQSAEILHGLGVFIQNAIQFAQTTLSIYIGINNAKLLEITIRDDGAGFAPHILSKLGEPYTSTRLDSGKNMGLGIFIAQTLLEDTGARISYNNLPRGGAQVKLEWTERALRSMFADNKL